MKQYNTSMHRNKHWIFISISIFLVSCVPQGTLEPISTYTYIPPSDTPYPSRTNTQTSTPLSEVDLDSFLFPYDVQQVMEVWDELSIQREYRYITYHIVNRSDRSIPYEDSCGYHPGDLISMLVTNTYYDDFTIDAQLPYSGTLKNRWITQGNDDGFTFFLGLNEKEKVFLNAYHTTVSHNSIGQLYFQGAVFGSFSYTRDHCDCGVYEAKIHYTIFNPSTDGGTDFLADKVNILDITKYALPPVLRAGYENNLNIMVTYEGPNFCDMTPQQKVNAILNTYLGNAGFCVDGIHVTYCGENTNFTGLDFTYSSWSDNRSIVLYPRK